MNSPRGVVRLFGCAFLAVQWLATAEVVETEPARGVSIEAKDLTPAERELVRRLTGPTGKEPWLIYGFRFGTGAKSVPRVTALEIYLQPDTENARLRRGRVLHVELSGPGRARRTAPWRIESTAKYAHVVPLGRRSDEVRGKWDLYRPFEVDGEFDDRTLFSLVALVGRGPEKLHLQNSTPSGRLDGALVITRVRRIGKDVEVRLNADDYHGSYVFIEERNGHLLIVKRGAWVV